MQDATSKLNNYISSGKIFIFSTTNCPYCDKAKQLMSMIKAQYGTITVTTDPDTKNDSQFIEALHANSGIRTYPKIYVGTKCYGGFSDVNALYQSGELYRILEAEGIAFTERTKA
jgi:glutaredoxin